MLKSFLPTAYHSTPLTCEEDIHVADNLIMDDDQQPESQERRVL